MNQIYQVSCDYFAPNKTLETIVVHANDQCRVLWIYNYKGISFDVFDLEENLIAYLEGTDYRDVQFNTERELDEWLLNLDLQQ